MSGISAGAMNSSGPTSAGQARERRLASAQPVTAGDVVTNQLLAEIDDFDPGEIAAAAKAYRYAAP
ncbi:MAG: hypothetical protein ACLQJR_12930 [Stellaceae bacterium]